MMKRLHTLIAALLTLVLLAGCAGAGLPPEKRTLEHTPAYGSINVNPGPNFGSARGSGSISYFAGVSKLESGQEQLMLDFLHTYYSSLCTLTVGDISGLFASDARAAARDAMDVWEVDVEIRKMQKTDLSLSGYSYILAVQSVTNNANGTVSIRTLENAIQNFSAYPGVDSESFNIGHRFTMKQTLSGWFLTEHVQFSGANNVLSGRRFGQSDSSYTPISKATLLEQARSHVSARSSQGKDPGQVEADNPYDRDAAVAYAKEWVGKRHPSWATYDTLGGNCQNFTSQAIHAGGIPMDHSQPGQWKWYGGTPNNSAFTASGRSSAWSGVADFLTYVRANEGYGMVAREGCPFYTGEPGDVIHLGTASGYRHTVIITQVMKDASGAVVDYLISSNTADLRNYPVSAYHYTNQNLIKIYGWNDG